jgi:hypothetical protein
VHGAELRSHIHSGLVMKFASMICSLVFAVACSPAPTGSRGPAQPASRALVSVDDLEQFPAGWNALDALNRLRPEFLSPVPTGFAGGPGLTPTVLVNGMHRGGLEMLRTLRLAEVSHIRYYRSLDATTRFGTNHNGAVIDVTLRR